MSRLWDFPEEILTDPKGPIWQTTVAGGSYLLHDGSRLYVWPGEREAEDGGTELCVWVRQERKVASL